MKSSSRLSDLVCEIQRLLKEEYLSRQDSNRRYDAIKEMFAKLKAAIEGHTDNLPNICQEKRFHGGKHAGDPSKMQGEWITLADAARIAGVHRGTITRVADLGLIKDNGQKGHRRRVEKPSVLQWIGKCIEKQRQRSFADYNRNLDDTPEKL
jgi:hypothetical protein